MSNVEKLKLYKFYDTFQSGCKLYQVTDDHNGLFWHLGDLIGLNKRKTLLNKGSAAARFLLITTYFWFSLIFHYNM